MEKIKHKAKKYFERGSNLTENMYQDIVSGNLYLLQMSG